MTLRNEGGALVLMKHRENALQLLEVLQRAPTGLGDPFFILFRGMQRLIVILVILFY